MAEGKKIKVGQCRVKRMREGGGTSMPWTWQECTVCGAHEDEECKLSEDAVSREMTNRIWTAETTCRSYPEVESDTRIFVKELLRQERIKTGTDSVKDTKENPLILLIVLCAFVALGILGGAYLYCKR